MRQSSLAVVLLLLASVGTASAECAWVLWTAAVPVDDEGVSVGDGSSLLRPQTTFPTEADCDRSAQSQKRIWAYLRELLEKRGDPPLRQTQKLLCLPDTIDPRGPRAK
jgi:hypothetical protein